MIRNKKYLNGYAWILPNLFCTVDNLLPTAQYYYCFVSIHFSLPLYKHLIFSANLESTAISAPFTPKAQPQHQDRVKQSKADEFLEGEVHLHGGCFYFSMPLSF